MDIYISADIEGIAGIAGWHQIIPGNEDYAMGRALMVGEVNAAIEGATAVGAKRIVVNDSHHHMTNLLPGALHPGASLISGHYKPMYMLQGLDETFDAVFFVGYHGAIGAPEAILSHTYNPRAIWEVRVDGQVVGEIGINHLVCEHFGVPLRLVTGDQATLQEASRVAPNAHGARVKRSFGRYSAESLSPRDACDLIRHEAELSLHDLVTGEPVRKSVEMELTFLVADMADMAEWIRGVVRTGPRTITFGAHDGLGAYRTFNAIITLTRSIVE